MADTDTQNSEEAQGAEGTPAETGASSNSIKLNAVYAFKVGMSNIYNEQGESIVVTVLKYEPWFVSQIKTADTDGYAAVQIACGPKHAKNAGRAETEKFKAAGFENGAKFVKEIRQEIPEGLKLGQRVELESLAKGDKVRITSRSKGHGFSGVVRRHNFAGGPASHGSKFHRRPGSIGNRTWPGRVMPGRKMAGQYGNENITVPNVQIVEVIPAENVLLVKGPVPGSRNSLVKLMKE